MTIALVLFAFYAGFAVGLLVAGLAAIIRDADDMDATTLDPASDFDGDRQP